MPPLSEPTPPGAAPGPAPGPASGQALVADDAESTQVLPPVSAAPSAGAPGGEPADVESTAKLRRIVPPQGTPPQPPAGGGPDAEATQVLPPVAGARSDGARPDAAGPARPAGSPPPPPSGAPAERPPLADFANLFRDGPGAAAPGGPANPAPGGVDATQRLPLFDQAAAPEDHPGDTPGGRKRRGPMFAVVALVAVGCALAGLAAGAALNGGDGGDRAQPQQSESPASDSRSTSQQDDAVRKQAKQLNQLLGQSNNSRASVIRAVEHIKGCTKLKEAAADLRSAALQRRELVVGLSTLTLDRLPNHRELTRALQRAWRASEQADLSYARWAEQVAGKNGCRKGRAVATDQLAAGNAASGRATEAKKKAASLWNPIARKYGLPERKITDL